MHEVEAPVFEGWSDARSFVKTRPVKRVAWFRVCVPGGGIDEWIEEEEGSGEFVLIRMG
jgi:hypothetical protein